MKPSLKDWIGLWHASHLVLVQAYIIFLVPAMFICTRLLMPKRSTLAGLILSAVSFLVVIRFPLGAAMWLIIEGLTIGEQTQYPLLNGISFAPFMALFGALAGAFIIRFIFRERIGKKGVAVLYAGNLLAAVLAVSAVLVWLSIYPPQFLA